MIILEDRVSGGRVGKSPSERARVDAFQALEKIAKSVRDPGLVQANVFREPSPQFDEADVKFLHSAEVSPDLRASVIYAVMAKLPPEDVSVGALQVPLREAIDDLIERLGPRAFALNRLLGAQDNHFDTERGNAVTTFGEKLAKGLGLPSFGSELDELDWFEQRPGRRLAKFFEVGGDSGAGTQRGRDFEKLSKLPSGPLRARVVSAIKKRRGCPATLATDLRAARHTLGGEVVEALIRLCG